MASNATRATIQPNKRGALHAYGAGAHMGPERIWGRSAYGAGAHIYDEAETVCESGQYSCGAVWMPPGSGCPLPTPWTRMPPGPFV
jgi:hypothetical protein